MKALLTTTRIFMKLGWRNLWRHKRRSWVVISSIALGLIMIMFSIGFINSMLRQMLDNNISTKLGHVAIYQKGFFTNMKLETNFLPDERIMPVLSKDRDIVAFSPRVKAMGMLRTSESSRGVLVFGVYPDREIKISKINEYTTKSGGSAYLDSISSNDILVSQSLASKLEVQVGDKIVLMLQDRHNDIVGVGLTAKGFFQTPVEMFDKSVVFMGIERLQQITGLGKNVSEIMIITKDKKLAGSVKKRILAASANPELDILSWEDMAPELVSLIKMIDKQMIIFYAIVFITIIFSIANTLIMSIMERFHEIGVMKSVGTRPLQIFFMVMFEALNLGVVGLAVGLTVAVAIIQIMGHTGVDLSSFMSLLRSWGTGSIIYPFVTLKDILVAVVVVEATTIIAAIYPAVKAARIKPLEALHFI